MSGPSDELRAAAQEFVERCERGEIRSKHSYTRFKAALAAPAIAPTVASDTVLQDALLEIDEMACTGLLPRHTPAEMRMLFKQIINEVRPALLASRAAAPATGAAQ